MAAQHGGRVRRRRICAYPLKLDSRMGFEMKQLVWNCTESAVLDTNQGRKEKKKGRKKGRGSVGRRRLMWTARIGSELRVCT